MSKSDGNNIERRRFLRLAQPVDIAYNAVGSDLIQHTVTKNISADGLRFETQDRSIKESDLLELKLTIQSASNPVHMVSRVVWKKRLSLQDNTPFDVGLEITSVEEDNKNTFLRFLCDLIYSLPETIKNENKKSRLSKQASH